MNSIKRGSSNFRKLFTFLAVSSKSLSMHRQEESLKATEAQHIEESLRTVGSGKFWFQDLESKNISGILKMRSLLREYTIVTRY